MPSYRQVHPAYGMDIRKEDFLWTMKFNPQKVLATLNNAIATLIAELEANFSRKQTVLVRRALMILRRHQPRINREISNTEPGAQDVESFDRYSSLCGMLGSIRLQLQNDKDKSPQNVRLAASLSHILAATHIELATNGAQALTDCITRFEFKYGLMSRVEHFNDERSEYHAAYAALNGRLTRMASQNLQARDAKVGKCLQQAQLIALTVREAENKPRFETGFAINVLELTSQLLDKPDDVALQTQYKKLALAAPGNQPRLRKIGGYMLAFLGMVVNVASALLLVTTGNPLAAIGLGAGTLMTGMGLFATRRRGLAKYLWEFREAEKKAASELIPIARSMGYAPGSVEGGL